jgi:hypothetical protein
MPVLHGRSLKCFTASRMQIILSLMNKSRKRPVWKKKQRTVLLLNEKGALPQFLLRVKPLWIAVAGIAFFLIVSCFVVRDYGMNIDSQKNFREGEMNLDYLLTGQVDQTVLKYQMHGAIIFMAADLTKRIFADALHLYDPIAARHILLPFITAIFLMCLFSFVKRHWGGFHGAATIFVLLTFPSFWGDTFNNIKDVPLLIFFSLSIMSFVDWRLSGSTKYLYRFFIFLGVASSIKTYAIFALLIIFVWAFLKPKDGNLPVAFPPRRILMRHAAAGFLIMAAIGLAFYAPAFWGISDKWLFLTFWQESIRRITWGRSNPFSLFPFFQVLFRTPLMILVCAGMGVFWAFREGRKSQLHSLLLFWTFIPLIIPCFPHTIVYHNGLRHFLVFLVPYSILAVVGMARCAGFLAEKMRFARKSMALGIACLAIGLSIWGVAATHPYQTTFFNALVGGLKGAQEKGLADSWDYWLNSYMEAGKWISLHGAANANAVGVYYSGTGSAFNADLVREGIDRGDIKTTHLQSIPVRQDRIMVPENTYMILVPFDYLRPARAVLEESQEFQKVHTITRQGGEIYTIYYKP